MSLIHDLRATPRLGILVAVAAATVGIIYGYDSSNIAGALLFITDEFGLSTGQQQLVTTAVVIGEVIGAVGGGALANRIGRKRSMVLVAATFAAFSLLSALAFSVPTLIGARFLLGLTIGVSVVVVPVFVAESAAPKVRGAMLVLYQVATVVGIIGGYLVAWVLADTGSWRWMLGLAAVPGLVIFLLLLRLPDTARWYMMRGRRADAAAVLSRVDPDADVVAELDDIEAALAEEQGSGRGSFANLREMFRKPFLRATLFVVGLGFFVQITGINAIVYYSPRIFQAMGFEGNAALLGLPALVQVAGLAAVFVSMVLVDRLGRRPILLTGIAIMIIANILLVAVFTRRLRLRRGADRTRLPRSAAVHRGLHLRFRRIGLGVRRRELPGPAPLPGLQRHADLRPGGQRRRRCSVPDPADPGGRGRHLRDLRSARGVRLRVRLQAGAGDQGPSAGRHPALLGERRHLADRRPGRTLRRPRVVSVGGRGSHHPRERGAVITNGYQLGLDIGGSKTQALLARHGVVVADVRGPSANPASVGLAAATRQLRLLIAELAGQDIDPTMITSVCAGAAGVDTPEQEARIAAVLTEALPAARVRVVHDSELLLAAAGTRTGIALIAGTGSVAWGRGPDGRDARAGGWGHALGDDGSGYGIARAAVRHVLSRIDAGLAPDDLSTALTAACGLARPGLLLDHFYAVGERRYWAEQSRTVCALAEAGDRAAYGLLTTAAGALATLVELVSLRLALAGPVIMAGGVLVHQPLVRRLLADRLAGIGVTDLRLLDADPALGAVRLAEHDAPVAAPPGLAAR